jgi:hypothetical protein
MPRFVPKIAALGWLLQLASKQIGAISSQNKKMN